MLDDPGWRSKRCGSHLLEIQASERSVDSTVVRWSIAEDSRHRLIKPVRKGLSEGPGDTDADGAGADALRGTTAITVGLIRPVKFGQWVAGGRASHPAQGTGRWPPDCRQLRSLLARKVSDACRSQKPGCTFKVGFFSEFCAVHFGKFSAFFEHLAGSPLGASYIHGYALLTCGYDFCRPASR